MNATKRKQIMQQKPEQKNREKRQQKAQNAAKKTQQKESKNAAKGRKRTQQYRIQNRYIEGKQGIKSHDKYGMWKTTE